MPAGPQLGRPGKDGEIVHRPGRDLTLSAPKSVSLAALVGGDARVAEAHGRAVERTLAWVEGRAVETRMKGQNNGQMIRAGGQKAVIATFTHETSRNLDPQLHTHAVIANMVQDADGIRIPRVVLVGDEKQLDAVDAGKPFAQSQQAGMETAVMDEILRQKDEELKEAVRASLAGEIGKAFGKLGDRIAEVNPDNLAHAAAARSLKLSPRERENTGLMAPSHALRREINGVIRGPAFEAERLVSHGYTSAEKMVAANYSPGDVVAFHRDYKSLGVAKGDERRVAGVDHRQGTVMLEGPEGQSVSWRPRQVGAKRGTVEVYRTESMELRAGDRIRWIRNDTGLGLVNSDTAEVAAVRGDRVAFRLGDGRMLEFGRDDPQLRHLDHAWASTVHAFQGRTVDNVIPVMDVARHRG